MKILKMPEGVIFDTENPNKIEFNPCPKGTRTPLHYLTEDNTVWEFLSIYFKPEKGTQHPIFKNFINSYFTSIG